MGGHRKEHQVQDLRAGVKGPVGAEVFPGASACRSSGPWQPLPWLAITVQTHPNSVYVWWGHIHTETEI